MIMNNYLPINLEVSWNRCISSKDTKYQIWLKKKEKSIVLDPLVFLKKKQTIHQVVDVKETEFQVQITVEAIL